MKLQSFKRLDKSDYPEKYQDLIDTLSQSLNIAIEDIYNALSNQISITDNIYCNVKDIQVKVDASGNPTTTTTFAIDSSINALKGLSVIKVDNITSTTVYPTGGITITYTLNNAQQVQIKNITGLPANNTFQLRIVAWG